MQSSPITATPSEKVVKLSDSNQRYTPKKYIDMAIAALGDIDLDPTADPSRRVPAKRHITESDDCFNTPWVGDSVWMNPPYSNARPFVERLCRHLEENPQAIAITLTHVGLMQTKGSQHYFRDYCHAYCFPQKRINFDYPRHLEQKKNNDRNSLFAYFGNPRRLKEFSDVFGELGLVLKP